METKQLLDWLFDAAKWPFGLFVWALFVNITVRIATTTYYKTRKDYTNG